MGFEAEIWVESLAGGTYGWTYVRNGSPLYSIGHRPFGAAARKGHKMDSLNCTMKNPTQNGYLGHIMAQKDG